MVMQQIFFKDFANIKQYNTKNPRSPIFPPVRKPNEISASAFDAVYVAAIALDQLIKDKGIHIRKLLNIFQFLACFLSMRIETNRPS